MSYQVILIKLLPNKYASDFLDGNLYLNTNVYFGKIDHTDSVRFDPHDGVDNSRQVAKVEIKDENGNWLPLPVVGPITIRSHHSNRANILCLYTVTDRKDDFFDKRNLDFGDVAIIIDDLLEFIRRVKSAATKANKRVHHGPITYVERAVHDGYMGPFRKYSELSYQNEFRFVFDNGTGSACQLPIGDIRDITHSIAATDVPKFWKSVLK